MQADADKCDSTTALSPAENALAESPAMRDSLEGLQQNGIVTDQLNSAEESRTEDEVLVGQSSADLTALSSQFSDSSAATGNVAFDEFTSMMLNNCTNNSALDSSLSKGNPLNQCSSADNLKSEEASALSFPNNHLSSTANHQSQEKIWSLIDPEFNGTPFDIMNQNISFSDPSVLPKPLVKRAITGGSANYPTTTHGIPSPGGALPSTTRGVNQLAMATNSTHYYGANGSKASHSAGLNWPLMAQQGPPTIQSHLNWSNTFNSSQMANVSPINSANNAVTASNPLANVWSNNVYGGLQQGQHPKRPPMCAANNMPLVNQKKPLYGTEGQAVLPGTNPALSPSKYRRNPVMANYKNFPANMTAPSSLYELGSAGSDNTSSSSDSANLRENGLLHLQERNIEAAHCSPLDTLRYSLEPQLLEIMRNSTPDNKAYNYGLPYQASVVHDDKKQLKNRNFGRRRDTDGQAERYSSKVFLGGLPPDIDSDEITASFRRFGPLVVDWPHKAESKSYFPPKGYAFLLFQDEASVQMLIDACIQEDDKLYLCVSSPTIKDKPVQIRPWRLSDADYVLDASMPLDPRKTVFVGGVPRPLKAVELAMIMDRLYGGVCYAGIDTDPELKYPKGAGRVAFSNQQSYIAAISARFVQLQHADIEKRVEIKPYILDDQICDECQGTRCGGKFAPYFCANITCLQYYCESCWANIHSGPARANHKPLIKEGERPRAIPFRWC